MSSVPDEVLADPDHYFTAWIPEQLAAHDGAAAHFGRVRAVAQFVLTGERGGAWFVTTGRGAVATSRGHHRRPSFTLTMGVDVWQRLNRGELDGMKAYRSKQIRFRGNWITFMRVARLFKG